MSARRGGARAPSDAGSWTATPGCRLALAGLPFRIDQGPELRVENRIAGRRGLLSDLLVLAVADGPAGGIGGRHSMTVGDLEAYVAAGLVSALVDVRAVDGERARRHRGTQDVSTPTDRPRGPGGSRSGPLAYGKRATWMPMSMRPPPAPRSKRSRPHYPASVVAQVLAAYHASPAANVSTIHARLRAAWPRLGAPPPSRSTVERWIRRERDERMFHRYAELNARRRIGDGGSGDDGA